MNRSPTSVLAWRTPSDLQVGDDDGFVAPSILRDVPLRVVTALEQWMLTGASGAPFLPADEVEQFRQLQDELRASGHVEPPANLAPFGVLALDSAPTSAATVRQLLAAGVRVEVDSQPTPVNTPRECAQLRHEVARACLGATLPERTIALLTSPYLPDPARTAPLMREDQPFVCVTVGDNAVEISPVVIPGETPCPGCQEAHRSQSDPGRAIIAAQLRTKPVPALSAGTGMMVGALAFQVMAAFGYEVAAPPRHAIVVDRRTLQAGRRIWAFHPACTCQRPDPKALSRSVFGGLPRPRLNATMAPSWKTSPPHTPHGSARCWAAPRHSWRSGHSAHSAWAAFNSGMRSAKNSSGADAHGGLSCWRSSQTTAPGK